MSGQVAKPRIFIDYIAYARAIGKRVKYKRGDGVEIKNYPYLFTLNPHMINEIETTNEPSHVHCLINHEEQAEPDDEALRKLLSTANYWGLLGHNLADLNATAKLSYYNNDGASDYTLSQSDIYTNIDDNYLLKSISGTISEENASGVSLQISGHTIGDELKLGCVTYGRTYTFPHRANLSMNISYSQSGIKRSRTAGGKDIVDIQYYKAPDWGTRRAWDFSPRDNRSIGYNGRRSWDLTFSYLTADDTLPSDTDNDFMFDTDVATGSWNIHSTENITSHFMTLTLNGQIPFIFQPDDTKRTFALCRLKSNGFSVQQSAPNLYTCKMSFEETW
tara:strand:+ start:412 stop:1410 length:999 start_codon:yes stop_codon:yes gene_type:complete